MLSASWVVPPHVLLPVRALDIYVLGVRSLKLTDQHSCLLWRVGLGPETLEAVTLTLAC